MAPLNQSGGGYANSDPNAILNECADIGRGIDEIDRNLNQMKMLQQRSLDDADSSASSATNRQLDNLSSETMTLYRSLVERVRLMKSNRDSQQPKNNAQVMRTDRRLKEAINAYQQVEAQFRKKTQEQVARQYRIVRPDADESEVRAAVEDPSGGQVFQQALMQSNRRGQAQSVLNAVQDRRVQLEKIEQQLIELAQLFQDMDTLVVQQEVAVTNIEQKAEETIEHFDKGNEQIGVAINTARSTRKKKWYCLGICVAIILVIVIIVVIYMAVNGKFSSSSSKKRSLDFVSSQVARVHARAWQLNAERGSPDNMLARFIEGTVSFIPAEVMVDF
ncbi:t-SNARE [Xylariales sp. PMI_506]|nr:t-SNARE [Xylariales sp. PMI_506]